MARKKRARRTAWHPMLVGMLKELKPKGVRVKAEHLLGVHPQRIDVVLLRTVGKVVEPPERLRTIFEDLAHFALIEFKGPTDDLEASDYSGLMAYGFRYSQQEKVEKAADLKLIWVADHLTPVFRRRAEGFRVTFAETEPGVWEGTTAGIALKVIETRVVGERDITERLLYTFCHKGLKQAEPLRVLAQVDMDAWEIYIAMCQDVQQLHQKHGEVYMRDFENFEEQKTHTLSVQTRRKVLSAFTPEERVMGLGVEERLKGLAPEELEHLRQLLLDGKHP